MKSHVEMKSNSFMEWAKQVDYHAAADILHNFRRVRLGYSETAAIILSGSNIFILTLYYRAELPVFHAKTIWFHAEMKPPLKVSFFLETEYM